MKPTLIASLLFGLVFAAGARGNDPAEQELKKLQGTWKVVSRPEDGRNQPPDERVTFVISGKKFSLCVDGMPEKEAGIRLDPKACPKALDLGSGVGNEIRIARAIYSLDGDTLTICVNARDESRRPTRFTGGPGYNLLILERVAPK
jgi:uncharacterized protein (TIGR03067 family)